MTGEEMKIYMKEYRKKNKERIKQQKREWKDRNPEKIKEYNKKYCEKNRERLAQKTREWREANPERHKEYCKKNLAAYMVPKEFEFRESLPKTMIGKVNYRELEKESKSTK